VRIACCLAVLSVGAIGAFAVESAARQAETRFGTVGIETDAVDRTLHRVVFGRRTVFEYQGADLEIAAIVPGTDRDFLLVAQESAGVGCPTRYVILEIASRRPPIRSQAFGSCSPMQSASLHRDTLIVQIPAYAANPAAMTEEALARTRRTVEVYSWSAGTLNRAMMRSD
jgi:hypothetical protein